MVAPVVILSNNRFSVNGYGGLGIVEAESTLARMGFNDRAVRAMIDTARALAR